MRDIPSHEDFLAAKTLELVNTARGVLDGSIGVIEGCRALAALRHQVDVDSLDPDFLPIIGIDSETDHLPVGDVRKVWCTEALAILEKEIEDAEEFHRAYANDACAKLIDRFGTPIK